VRRTLRKTFVATQAARGLPSGDLLPLYSPKCVEGEFCELRRFEGVKEVGLRRRLIRSIVIGMERSR
jgi:hypothetical protein